MSRDIRVLVVDDSAFNRQTIKKMLESAPGIKVAGIASDGMDAMAKVMKLQPDIITLDLEMPKMDGFSFLRWLMAERPTPVIMVTSNNDRKVAFRALELGAVDFIAKPSRRASIELRNIERDLLAKVHGAKGLNMDVLSRNIQLFEEKSKASRKPARRSRDIEFVAIGTSTGGPPALKIILEHMPSDFPCPIAISQHMPKGFTKPLADRLNGMTGLRVKEAKNGDIVGKGSVLVCPGGYHMGFEESGGKVRVVLEDAVFEDKYVPSVDKMMVSAVNAFGRKTLGVVLTGMGNDGKKGMVEIKSNGGYTIAESEETAVVFGMPGEVIKAGAARKVLPLDRVPSEIIRVVMGERRV